MVDCWWTVLDKKRPFGFFTYRSNYLISLMILVVDQPEIGTNQSYLIDTIRLSVSPKQLNPEEICNLFVG